MSDPIAVPTVATRQLRPYLVVGDARAAIDFYGSVFGAVVVGEVYVGDDGRIGHCELSIDGAGLYLADAYPEVGAVAPEGGPTRSVSMHLEVADADATMAAAIASGATLDRAVEDRGYGARSGALRDPFGHHWILDQAIPLTREDVERQMAEQGFTLETSDTLDLGERAPRPGTSDA